MAIKEKLNGEHTFGLDSFEGDNGRHTKKKVHPVENESVYKPLLLKLMMLECSPNADFEEPARRTLHRMRSFYHF